MDFKVCSCSMNHITAINQLQPSGKEEYSFIQGWVLQQDVESIRISTRNAGLKPRDDAGYK
jgi:hypothetical protein